MPPFAQLDRRSRAYVVSTLVVGLVVLVVTWLTVPVKLDVVPELLYLAVGVQIAALMPIKWRAGYQYIYDPLLIAAGLVAPGAGVCTVAWLALYDGRRPGRDAPLWALAFNRANAAIVHGTVSVLVANLFGDAVWSIPARTLAYAGLELALNYAITAGLIARVQHSTLLATLYDNVGLLTIGFTLVLGFAGGIVYELLKHPAGYLLCPGVFGFVLAVRGNVADVQRQTVLREQTLALAAQALDARDAYTESHSARVAQLAVRIGEALRLSGRDIDRLRTAGTLHDLGKIGIRDHILHKSGQLSQEEWVLMRQHPDIGADMIGTHAALADVAPLVRRHHERWDGTGYPSGLSGEEIPLGARVLAVADSFDTITTPRLYRPTVMPTREAALDIADKAGKWYDPSVVAALFEAVNISEVWAERHTKSSPATRTTLAEMLGCAGFARLIMAIAVSAFGDPMTAVAILTAVYVSARDPKAVAAVFVVQAAATILTALTLGGLSDRLDRRRLAAGCDSFRFVILLTLPLAFALHPWLVYLLVALLSSANAVVVPARLAAIADLLPSARTGLGNAVATGVATATGALGYAFAGLWLSMQRPVLELFVIDGFTFLVAALLVWSIGPMGVARPDASITGSLRGPWREPALRPHLLLVIAAGVCISMTFPALFTLAYQLSSHNGSAIFGLLETFVTLGILTGSVVAAYLMRWPFAHLGLVALAITGVVSLAVAGSTWLPLTAVLLLTASIGNPIYTVSNTTNLLQLSSTSLRGTVMSARFGLGQCAVMIGAAMGGLLSGAIGGRATYGVVGLGLLAVATVFWRATRSKSAAHVESLAARPMPIDAP